MGGQQTEIDDAAAKTGGLGLFISTGDVDVIVDILHVITQRALPAEVA